MRRVAEQPQGRINVPMAIRGETAESVSEMLRGIDHDVIDARNPKSVHSNVGQRTVVVKGAENLSPYDLYNLLRVYLVLARWHKPMIVPFQHDPGFTIPLIRKVVHVTQVVEE